MVRKTCGLLVVTALGAWIGPVWCQTTDLPPAPIPLLANPGPTPLSGTPTPEPASPPTFSRLTGPPACAPYEDCNGPLLQGDPLLDRPQSPPPGWFGAIEAGAFGPHIKNRLAAPVTVDGVMNTIQLPTANLDWTGAPRIEVGYRLPEGSGEVLVAYHSVVTDGTAVIPGFDLNGGDGFLKSRLNVNVVDLDYASREFFLGPSWDVKWRIGLRLASVFFDSRATGFFTEERVSNDFRGAGPHAGLDLWRYLDVPGLAFFARVDGASVIGDIRQAFEQTFNLDGTQLGGATNVHQDQTVPVVTAQFGLGWTPAWPGHWLRFAAGYEIEQWWYLGQAGISRAELTVQGIFFRGEYNY